MNISDLIAQQIIRVLDESEKNIAEIQRNELAANIGCVPSQINYVLSSRFTPEHGYIIESRRGGGGYIRITRIRTDRSSAIMHIVNSIGSVLDENTARIVLENLMHAGVIEELSGSIMQAATSQAVMREVPAVFRDKLRASMVKRMLIENL